MRLLRENLTPVQRQQYDRYGYFEVVGGKTGKRYRIRHGRSMNIDQLDRNGRRVCGWCFFPEGNLVTGDVMLAQKTALGAVRGRVAQDRQQDVVSQEAGNQKSESARRRPLTSDFRLLISDF